MNPGRPLSIASHVVQGLGRPSLPNALLADPTKRLAALVHPMSADVAGPIRDKLAALPCPVSPPQAQALLVDALERAHHHLFALTQRDRAHAGAGAFAVAIALVEQSLVVVSVGPCAAFRLRNGHVVRLTRDDTLRGALARGELAPLGDGAQFIEEWTIPVRGLGVQPAIDLSVRVEPHEADDVLLLCIERHRSAVPEQELRTILSLPSADAAARAFCARAHREEPARDVPCVVVR